MELFLDQYKKKIVIINLYIIMKFKFSYEVTSTQKISLAYHKMTNKGLLTT